MRKRIIIGLLACGVGALALGMLLGSRKGTVEYHKAKCWRAMNAMVGKRTWLEQLAIGIGLPTSNPVSDAGERYEKHTQALLDLGYLETREFRLTNSPDKPSGTLARWAAKELPEDRLWRIQVITNNVLRIVAERHSLKKWEEAVQRIDVPESGK